MGTAFTIIRRRNASWLVVNLWWKLHEENRDCVEDSLNARDHEHFSLDICELYPGFNLETFGLI